MFWFVFVVDVCVSCFVMFFLWGLFGYVLPFACVYVLCFGFRFRHIVDMLLCFFVAFWVSAVRALLNNSLAQCLRPVS